MPLLTKKQKRTMISALRSSNVRAVDQKYNEPARLWCNEEWITAGCLRCTDPRCMKFTDAEISCRHFPDFSYERDLNVAPLVQSNGILTRNFQKLIITVVSAAVYVLHAAPLAQFTSLKIR